MSAGGVDASLWSPDVRGEVIGELSVLVGAVQAELGAVITAADAAGDWRADGATDMAAWLVARCAITTPHAREWVRVGAALEVLPALRAGLAEGVLSWDQVRAATRFATAETDAPPLAPPPHPPPGSALPVPWLSAAHPPPPPHPPLDPAPWAHQRAEPGRVCWTHHRLVHEGGWTVTGNADGELVFTSPTGRRLTSRRQPTRPHTRTRAAALMGLDPPTAVDNTGADNHPTVDQPAGAETAGAETAGRPNWCRPTDDATPRPDTTTPTRPRGP